ncbi:protein phosphatase 2c [Plasmopara halstedii]|uniref:Protein phosphatase 2c n=1 Tax=Plasmopara halstedii TaxID=4781 RepID=A0A0N7L7S0_PLAHL|nr:protein phosphatase 2c [Plasmopara halstedii]CEG47851.1 protein phosphatase 2c [Plasmopara halstedii]|eukprot:XP_024584220.1 protein phosphatase 2c [Plasmopara halstedii]
MAPADILVASPSNGIVGLEMCSATPPDNCKSPHAPRLLQHAGLRALKQIAADDSDVTKSHEATTTMTTSPRDLKCKRKFHSPTTSAGSLDNEDSETSPDELEDSQPSPPLSEDAEEKPNTPSIKCFVAKGRDRKRRKVDVIESALKRFHDEKADPPRCVEFTTVCHPISKSKRQAPKQMRVQIGVSLAQGARAYMEDRYSVVERLFINEEDKDFSPSLLAIYDGHNGAYASEYARRRFKDLLSECEELIEISRRAQLAEMTEADVKSIRELLVDAFATVDAEILQRTIILNKRDGSTVLLGLLVGGKLFVANLGDSRGILSQIDHNEEVKKVSSVIRLSVDHKPDRREETERVEEAGGKVIFSGCWRVAHDQVSLRLAISRSLGDHPLKLNLPESCLAPLVSVVPDIRVLNVEAAGEYLVFASDGLWDRLSDDDAAAIVHSKVAEFCWSEESASPTNATKEALQFAANALVEAALLKRSMDNITAMVILFSQVSDEEA